MPELAKHLRSGPETGDGDYKHLGTGILWKSTGHNCMRRWTLWIYVFDTLNATHCFQLTKDSPNTRVLFSLQRVTEWKVLLSQLTPGEFFIWKVGPHPILLDCMTLCLDMGFVVKCPLNPPLQMSQQ